MNRLKPRHIQTRLTLWLLASVLVLVAVFWLVTARAPVMLTEHYVVDRLAHDAETLVVGLEPGGNTPRLDPTYANPIYERPYSGHYYQLDAGGTTLRSRSLWDFDFQPKAVESFPATYHAVGPSDQPLLVYADRMQKQGTWVEVHVAEDLSTLMERIETFRWRFAIVALIILGIMLVAQRLIVRASLRPLDRVQRDCRRLQEGEIDRLDEAVPPELQPMVGEINHLQDAMQRRLSRSRKALGNLAHALKTPITLIDQVLQRSRDDLPPETAERLAEGVARMRQITDRELRHARMAGESRGGERFDVERELPRLLGMFRHLHPGKHFAHRLDCPAGALLRADREDMYELLGNLLDNAAKWADRRIEVEMSLREDGWRIEIADDGPGVPEGSLRELAQRGTRMDESRDGHGLGLAIVRELVELYGGHLSFSRSPALGGLAVEIRLP
ncbi:HAMP domain-containing sensor histidine kinase [Guyparkeria halophila]|uniref:histidine kinase n=1 Tax=Guyparkeria halophila TaxID=47960 RepID=A0ABZ0YXG4_9GAMM|nr:HAMP domain-containing sensor histidine kinase [Guyparkeria halophila]WQH16099.1 HAMP domain-containing sensor histidine kinase [Guyparkeria halophila]